MANNRMWLVHKPSKLGILLGKRMALGWYSAPAQNELNRFYTVVSCDNQDDFLLVMEDCSKSTCFNNWKYTDKKANGFIVFEIND